MNRTSEFPAFKHAICWVIYIAYEISFVRFSVGRSAPVLHYVCYYALNISLFYFNAYVLLAAALRNKLPYLAIVGLMLAELLVYLLLKYLLDGLLAAPGAAVPRYLEYMRLLVVPNLYRGISFLGSSTLYWSVRGVIRFQRQVYETERERLVALKEKAELERNLAESVNAYLQQQINPHFLFNTLTFIHNTYYKYSPEASQCVLLLSDIMRFSLEEVGENGKTGLDKEIEQVNNFIELNQLRFHHALNLDVQIAGDFEGREVIPLILLTLTENIFKHGYLKDKAAPARLYVNLDQNDTLHFHSWNLKKHEPGNKRLRAIGIRNVIKRLEYSYRDNYTLDINDEADSYEIRLKICL